ncbi:MAG: hypothetical protein LBV58_02580 [Acholeplasmatales bacterium]|jgi:hypothetical protein|nr:hypothetical protein [Acholeplasmatales bacterium]
MIDKKKDKVLIGLSLLDTSDLGVAIVLNLETYIGRLVNPRIDLNYVLFDVLWDLEEKSDEVVKFHEFKKIKYVGPYRVILGNVGILGWREVIIKEIIDDLLVVEYIPDDDFDELILLNDYYGRVSNHVLKLCSDLENANIEYKYNYLPFNEGIYKGKNLKQKYPIPIFNIGLDLEVLIRLNCIYWVKIYLSKDEILNLDLEYLNNKYHFDIYGSEIPFKEYYFNGDNINIVPSKINSSKESSFIISFNINSFDYEEIFFDFNK